jgi:ATP-dependent exoDNAse (exonuclease V) beta subunit
MTLADVSARCRALTDLDHTLLVEAAAGTGKTALMAGRAAMLLASGVAPARIAAITFTELAAGELALRIRSMVEALLGGETPEVLQPVLPDGLSEAQSANLRSAAASLDELTATTIHGFCRDIIRAYAVEADLDPGATVMEAAQADAMFDGVFSRWLSRRLGTDADRDSPVAVLAQDDPLGVVKQLRELADLRRARPTAQAAAVDLTNRPDVDFCQAVDDFRRWFSGVPAEPKTAEALEALQALSGFYVDTLGREVSFAELWRLGAPPRQPLMKSGSYEWRAYAAGTSWRRTVEGQGAIDLSAQAELHYDSCRRSFEALLAALAGAMVSRLSAAMDELIEDYAREKRAAAALDFDDLLARARELVRGHEPVRQALGRRYAYIFVDEFQDTDPIQAEIIFRIAAGPPPQEWEQADIKPGALFLVGDPKQAIYRFRGAHIATYSVIKRAFESANPEAIIRITANFRSRRGILEHVNRCFEPTLSLVGQPGYVALSATLEDDGEGALCAAKVTIELPPGESAASQRDEEAARVAEICRRLVGNLQVRRADGASTSLRPGDIALLAPTHTELWRYERALEALRISVASQAGKTLMLRQETQDVLALMRTLADPFDTLAFGAFMRGPMVGLSEAALLAVTAELPARDDGAPSLFTVTTPVEQVAHPVAKDVLSDLQILRRRAADLTPSALLAEAIERLRLRVALALRTGDRSARSLANLDALIERARAYGVRGLTAFVADLDADWSERRSLAEGRVDESDDAVALVTVHSSKGLEWPVVIPINTSTKLRGPDRFVHRQSDNTLHWVIGGVLPPELATAQAEEGRSAARERERLWYVACTRARDLLILPHLVNADGASWSKVLDLGQAHLPELDLTDFPPRPSARRKVGANGQTREIFVSQGAQVLAAAPPVRWRRPSDHDADRNPALEDPPEIGEAVEAGPAPLGAGRLRGLLLHKLMEELLTGELAEEPAAVESRAHALAAQLAQLEATPGTPLPDAAECSATALRTLALPDVAALRPHLMPEASLWWSTDAGELVAGRADVAAVEGGAVTVVLDWKSDVAPTVEDRRNYAGQLGDYLTATGARRGAIVFMTTGEVIWVPGASD